ncbi:hypothetical protein BJV85_001317 [Clostridium acetobutylicum]|nr:hypothetical protein [Clostridium acetobutylicum]
MIELWNFFKQFILQEDEVLEVGFVTLNKSL